MSSTQRHKGGVSRFFSLLNHMLSIHLDEDTVLTDMTKSSHAMHMIKVVSDFSHPSKDS